MISCTEFIPAYSTLFTYLEENFGPDEVPSYWGNHFDYTKSTLYQYVRKEGIRGCYTYWTGTLNEEAADFTMYLDEEKGYYYLDMHHCPSKGRLLKLKEELGAEPYHGNCLHCDYYRAAIEACGLRFLGKGRDVKSARRKGDAQRCAQIRAKGEIAISLVAADAVVDVERLHSVPEEMGKAVGQMQEDYRIGTSREGDQQSVLHRTVMDKPSKAFLGTGGVCHGIILRLRGCHPKW